MAKSTKATAVPTEVLCTGLYVVKLDRPWIETPFLFQGFRIACDEELTVLRETCQHVYIDPRRSEPESIRALRDALARRKARREPQSGAAAPPDSSRRFRQPSTRAMDKSSGALFMDVAEPDRKRFRTLVQAARASRHEATVAITDALGASRMGKALDLRGVRTSVERLTDLAVSDPSASLWLTRLREKSDLEARHAVNTCVLCLAFGTHLGMRSKQLRRLGLGALLHDIGKTRIPMEILNKPERLDLQELDIMRRHPYEGVELLEKGGHCEREILDMVLLHHERWRGQGYPHGMLGDTIPRHALIVGLMDCYDAMTSDRPHRPAMPPEKAMHEIYNGAKENFGVELVQEFIRCIGIFPVGSVVELDNGAHAVVVGSKPGCGLWPTILLVRNPDGEMYRKRLLLNLAVEAQHALDGKGRHIRRAVSPSSVGIDVTEIVRTEFGLDESIAA